MADEEAAPAAPAPASAPEGEAKGGEGKKKGLFANPIVLIAIAAVLGGGLGVGGMMLVGGGKKEPAKKAAKAEKKKGHGKEEVKEEADAEEEEAPADEAEAEAHDEEKKEEKEPKEEKAHEGEKKEEASEEAEGHKAEGGEETAGGGDSLFKFEPVIVNVVEKNSLHYLKLQMAMETSNPEVAEEIKAHTPELRDALLFLINDMTLREILSSAGKAFLKEDIKASFNKFLKKGEVKKIYFTDFTIQ